MTDTLLALYLKTHTVSLHTVNYMTTQFMLVNTVYYLAVEPAQKDKPLQFNVDIAAVQFREVHSSLPLK